MQQEILKKFWNLPGVLGVAIIYGQGKPYFYVKTKILDWEKQAITQVFMQVVTTNLQKVDDFEFKVMGYYAYTYKLTSQLTILVLATNSSSVEIKLMAVNQLKAALQEDIGNAITTFDLLSKKIPEPRAVATAKPANSYELRDNSNTPLKVNVTIEELLLALNHLSRFSSNYLGAKLTANNWQLTRPKFDWLDNFRINSSAEIVFSGTITEYVSASQHQWVKEWTAAFIKRCAQIIQDLPTMIEKIGLDERKKILLLTPRAS